MRMVKLLVEDYGNEYDSFTLTWYIRLQHVPSAVPCRTTVRVVLFDLHFVRHLVHIVQCVQRQFFVQRKPTRLANGAFVQRAYSCQTLNVHRCFAFAIRSRLALFHAHVALFFSFKRVSILARSRRGDDRHLVVVFFD